MKVFGFTVSIPRNIGFLFTNLSLYYFTQNNGLRTSADLERFNKEQGDAKLTTEMLFASAQAYCQENKKNINFEKSKLYVALISGSEQQQKDLFSAWGNSQTFGAKIDQKKKKIR